MTSNDMVVREGTNVTLMCKARGYPEPYVSQRISTHRLWIKCLSIVEVSTRHRPLRWTQTHTYIVYTRINMDAIQYADFIIYAYDNIEFCITTIWHILCGCLTYECTFVGTASAHILHSYMSDSWNMWMGLICTIHMEYTITHSDMQHPHVWSVFLLYSQSHSQTDYEYTYSRYEFMQKLACILLFFSYSMPFYSYLPGFCLLFFFRWCGDVKMATKCPYQEKMVCI